MEDFAPDTVIALGGGSAMDTAKAVCHLYAAMKQEQRPRLVAVPTTSGTGSEVTSFAVISDPEAQAKYPLKDPAMVPDVAFLDPVLTATVPSGITADTGMDVLTHGLEAYVSTQSGDFTDACAEKAGPYGMEVSEQAVADGSNMDARTHMHNASCLAGIAFNGASLGICHSLAHALGARFHIPHGRSNAILLPHVITYNAGLRKPVRRKRFPVMWRLQSVRHLSRNRESHGPRTGPADPQPYEAHWDTGAGYGAWY